MAAKNLLLSVLNTNRDGVLLLAESLRKDMEKTDFGKAGKQTFSAGVAILENNDTLESLIRKADKALYRAKNNGRNQVTGFQVI